MRRWFPGLLRSPLLLTLSASCAPTCSIPLFAEVETLKGVGPQVAKQLAKLGITRAVDLLFHLPTGAIERVRAPAASPVLLGRQVILDVTVREIRQSRGRGPTRIHAVDGEGNMLTLAFFNNGAGRPSSCRSARRAPSPASSKPMATSGRWCTPT